jgi:hypothetical protein
MRACRYVCVCLHTYTYIDACVDLYIYVDMYIYHDHTQSIHTF